ncbi:MAG: glycosyltransferase family 9 protein [Armatimonadota bacterium]|nr:glycosyltransferase family 9 protein [Armatimonadota bacterium]
MILPKSILLVKLSAIGDVVMATPVAESLRRAFPSARIAWLVERRCADAVIGNPHLDEVLVSERLRGLSFIPTLKTALGLRARRFDLAIDLQGLARSALMVLASGAKSRIGFDNGREFSHLCYNVRVGCDVKPHGMACHRKLLEPLGIAPDAASRQMLFPLSEDDISAARELLSARGLSEDSRLAALAPATTRAYKHWVEDRWAELADRLSAQMGMTPVFLGGPSDRALIARIQAAMSRPSVSLAGETSIKSAAAVVKRSQLSVTVDNGLMHVSVALGAPTVGICGPTTAWMNHVDRPNYRVVMKEFACAPCRKRVTCEQFDCMRAISVDDVARLVNHTWRQLANPP